MRKVIVCLLIGFLNIYFPKLILAQNTNQVLIRNATVMTASKGTLQNTDILIENGKITRIGKNLKASANAKIIDASGKYVTPGIIDCHSHTMIDAVNEFSYSVTSMTNIKDVLNPKDIAVYRALAGGVTAALILHGSANAIGGQSVTVKFKYGRPVDEFIIPDAPPGIKFALGENQKIEFSAPARTNSSLSAHTYGSHGSYQRCFYTSPRVQTSMGRLQSR